MVPSSNGTRRTGRLRRALLVAAALTAPAVLVAGGAQAAPTPPGLPAAPRLLREGAVLRGTADSGTFAPFIHAARWSVLALHSDAGADYDLTVTGAGLTATSDFYAGQTDFVAIDAAGSGYSGIRAKANLWGGSGGFDIAFNEQDADASGFAVHSFGQVIQVGGDQWPTDYPVYRGNNGDNVAAVYDVQLTAGQNYLVNATNSQGNLYLMQSDPAAGIQAANRAVVAVPAGARCRWFRPRSTGVYGLIVTFDNASGGYLDPVWADVVKATASQASGQNCGGVVLGR